MQRIPSRIRRTTYHTHTARIRDAEELKRRQAAEKTSLCLSMAMIAAGLIAFASLSDDVQHQTSASFQHRANVDAATAHLITSVSSRLR